MAAYYLEVFRIEEDERLVWFGLEIGFKLEAVPRSRACLLRRKFLGRFRLVVGPGCGSRIGLEVPDFVVIV